MQTVFKAVTVASYCAWATATPEQQMSVVDADASCPPSAHGSASCSNDAVTLLQTTLSSYRRTGGEGVDMATGSAISPAAAVGSAMTSLEAALDTAMKQRDAALEQRDEAVARAKQAMLHAKQAESSAKQQESAKKAMVKAKQDAEKKDAEKKDAAFRKTLQRWEVALTSAKKAMKQRDAALSEAQKKLKREDEEMKQLKQEDLQRNQVLQKTSQQRDAALTEAKKATASLRFIEGELEEMKKVMKQSVATRKAYKQALLAREMAMKSN